MNITLRGFVHYQHQGKFASVDTPPRFVLFSSDMSNYGYTLIQEVDMPFTLPPGFSPHAAEVAALEAENAKALEDFQKSVASINERLSKRQALTNEVVG